MIYGLVYSLWSFGTFLTFWYVWDQEKSGNPESRTREEKKFSGENKVLRVKKSFQN
jgi:hypothetical protein